MMDRRGADFAHARSRGLTQCESSRIRARFLARILSGIEDEKWNRGIRE
jgi:hypothetical protein